MGIVNEIRFFGKYLRDQKVVDFFFLYWLMGFLQYYEQRLNRFVEDTRKCEHMER